MKIEIAEHGRMTESGSSLLRLIQNQDIPLLDLLIRESIQNSLDAAVRKDKPVKVDISVGEFPSADLNRHFEKIEDGLNRRYKLKKCKYIAVRDSNTVGLTGPVRYSEVKNNQFGNLLKLVYEICKPQSNEGAGGSWGLGKTIYFRAGIGLVIYYSRICKNKKYQSRLAACLVEDETKSSALIPYGTGVKRGIAWWGKRDTGATDTTVPLDDEREIEKILSVFGITPYTGNETGTTIIVPYINEKQLLNEAYAINDPADKKPYWINHLQDYFVVAIQRWYAPRMLNRSYPYGAWLDASVNGEKIKVSQMLSLFRYIRELYILATTENADQTTFLSEQGVTSYVESIDLKGVLNSQSAGKLAYARFSRKDLEMEPPVNQKTPYQQIDNFFRQTEDDNDPIIAYTRQPGMIVGYDHDGPWTHHMPKSAPDEYIIGLFVVNSTNTLKEIDNPGTDAKITLEEYIRKGEKADHASWTDRNIDGKNPRIVANIQKNTINKIKKRYIMQEKGPVERQHIGLGHALADMLLPESDFGNDASQPKSRGGSGSEPKKPRSGRKSTIRISGEPVYSNGTVKYPVEIFLKKKPCIIALQVITDFKRYEADSWESEEEIGKPFPMEIEHLTITEIQPNIRTVSKPTKCNISVNQEKRSKIQSGISVHLFCSSVYSTCSYAKLDPDGKEYLLKGTISLAFKDSGIKGAFELKESVNE